MDLADLEWWSICLVLSDIRNGRWYDYHCLFDMYLYTYRLCVCFLLLICQRTKYLLILAAPSFRRFCYRRKNLFWFQWFSSGDPSIPQNHRLHSASKFVAGTVTYIFLREHYGTLASLNFYHQVVLPADSLPICRTAACRLGVGMSRVYGNFIGIRTAWIYPLPSNSCKMNVSRDSRA